MKMFIELWRTKSGGMDMLNHTEQELINQTPRMSFDSRRGIQELLEKKGTILAVEHASFMRNLWLREGPHDDSLCEFVVNGKYILDSQGGTKRIVSAITVLEESIPAVTTLEEFLKITGMENCETRLVTT